MVWLLPRSPKKSRMHTQKRRPIRARTFGFRRVCRVGPTRVIVHCEASLIYCGGDIIIRSMTRVAHLTLCNGLAVTMIPQSRVHTQRRPIRARTFGLRRVCRVGPIRVFEHSEASLIDCGDDSIVRSMSWHKLLTRRCNGWAVTTNPQTRAHTHRETPDPSTIFGSRRVWVATPWVFEHCEASLIDCGGDTIIRSMTQAAHPTLQWFGCYHDPPNSRTHTERRPIRARIFGSRRVWVAATWVFEHCEASLTDWVVT
jgi:hypothetical protein